MHGWKGEEEGALTNGGNDGATGTRLMQVAQTFIVLPCPQPNRGRLEKKKSKDKTGISIPDVKQCSLEIRSNQKKEVGKSKEWRILN